jgi:rubrerythrin
MKTSRLATLLLAALPVFSTTSLAGGGPAEQTMPDQNRENLLIALRGEAFAFVTYSLYAERARQEGHDEVAAVFESAARQERTEHFAEIAKLYGLIGTTESNLQTAIQGETRETNHIYPGFAAAARAVGANDVAERFEEIAKDERKHADKFTSLLRSLQGQR